MIYDKEGQEHAGNSGGCLLVRTRFAWTEPGWHATHETCLPSIALLAIISMAAHLCMHFIALNAEASAA
jgi:hypothetical protein